MTKEQAKLEIQSLINRYELKKSQHLLPKYNEAMTRKDFILPLFKALGWDIHNEFSQEFIEEEKAIQGRIDYVCQIDNVPKLFLEIKKIKIDLDEEKWAKQVISYAYHKGIPWAVLSDFEGIKVFNAEWEVTNPEQCKFFELKYTDYLEKFDKWLWLFSKESIVQNKLNERADQLFKRPKRIPIGERLTTDLVKWRDKLKTVFEAYNTVAEETIDEAIQRFLDRLIFIRTIEDRGIEERLLWQALQKWISRDRKPGLLLEELRNLFRQYDEWYNSKLFRPHTCDALDAEESYFEEIINDLYRGKGLSKIPYDFSKINADVLGSIYEQYLGEIQRRGTKDATRKKHGIYYTPTYIVEYIVNNTLGKILKEKSLQEVKNLKILDPACGSGSFLIKAFELMNNYLREAQNENGVEKTFHHLRKFRILNENIYGVDLDPKATEIARLNLLLKSVEFREKLPMLTDNIKEGNSLISGSEKELEKYFGKNWPEKKPFDWRRKFPEVLKKDGFDVVIGNPPWVESRKISFSEKTYFSENYKVARRQYDLFNLFIEKSLNLLKENGILAFIVPNRYISNLDYDLFRKYLLDNTKIIEILDLGDEVFENVNMPSSILILQKTKFHKNIIRAASPGKNLGDITYNSFQQTDLNNVEHFTFSIWSNSENTGTLSKIKNNSVPFSQFVNNARGIEIGKDHPEVSDQRLDDTYVEFLFGEDIGKFKINRTHFIKNNSDKIDYKTPSIFTGKRILVRKTGQGITATIDDKTRYCIQVVYIFKAKRECPYDLSYLLAILNSKLMSFYYHSIFGEKNRKIFPHLTQGKLLMLPIKKINLENPKEKILHNNLGSYVDKVLKLNKKLLNLDVFDSDKAEDIKKEIKETDRLIDQKVYELYGLNKKEIEIIQNS